MNIGLLEKEQYSDMSNINILQKQCEGELIDDPNGITIKLLVYNVFMRPPLVKNYESDYKDARLDEISKYMKDYDILCFQEVFTPFSSRQKKLIENGRKYSNLKYSAKSPNPWNLLFRCFVPPYINGGLLTLSRYEISDEKFQEFPKNCSIDTVAKKGVLYTKICHEKDLIIHLFNTHLQACYDLISKDSL